MATFPIHSDLASLSMTQIGGHLSDVSFTLADGRRIMPMHVAPWVDEALAPDIPPIIRVLRGDFLCAPFGSSDLLPDMPLIHGLPANGAWNVTGDLTNRLEATLDGDVMGATVTKQVELRKGERVVYQRHTLTGGSGQIPIGHHAMLRADSELKIAFSPWSMALTPPDPVEVPPLGRPLLQNGQTITDLHNAQRADGGTVDLTIFPSPEGFEALWMVVADRRPEFAWTAATSAEGWVWFGLKNPRVLPQTLVWFSNGGRDYAPWNGRHRRVIGLEEICAYFHLGHKASMAENPVSRTGSPTTVTLTPDVPVTVCYMFGIAPIPDGFGAVTDIVRAPGGVKLLDAAGHAAFAACDPSFVAGVA